MSSAHASVTFRQAHLGVLYAVIALGCAAPSGGSSEAKDDVGAALDVAPDVIGDVPAAAETVTPPDQGASPECGDETCDPLESAEECPEDCRDEHWCDTHCGLGAPSGCSCTSLCVQDGTCCDDVGGAPDGSRFDCLGSTCGSCQPACVPVCDGKGCADGCGGYCPSCDDESDCTENDRCVGTVCSGDTVNCDDGNVCTNDGCTFVGGCWHSHAVATCNDGDSCTQNDFCEEGGCKGGSISCACAGGPSCDDGDECTVDSCNASKDACVSAPLDCDDDNGCTTDSCESGGCVHAPDAAGKPSNTCPPVTCRIVTGACVDGEAACLSVPDAGADGMPCPGGFCAGGVCVPPECPPLETRCVDAATMQTCDAKGFWGTLSPCGAGDVCSGTACVAQLCTPGEIHCAGDRVEACDAFGLIWELVDDCGADGDVCSGGACLTPVCTPGAVACADAGHVSTCKADSLGFTEKACLANESCLGGTCKPRVCAPGATRCTGSAVLTCDDLGLSESSSSDCGDTGEVCSEGVCLPPVCSPGAVECHDDTVSVCNPDSLGFTDVPCSGGQTCVAGECVWNFCSPGSLLCSGKAVVQCADDGQSASLVEDCDASGQTCALGACTPLVCTDAENTCLADQKTSRRCNEAGTAFVDVLCSGTCYAGGCAAPICPTGTATCQGETILACNAAQTAYAVGEDCSAKGQFCLKGLCMPRICTPGAKRCEAGVSSECDDRGTAWVSTPCAAGTICVGTECVTATCVPNSVYCQGTFVVPCDAAGQPGSAITNCAAAGKFCSAGECVVAVCLPGTTSCSNDQRLSCKADGSGWSVTSCNDNTSCTVDTCDPATGKCIHPAKNCDDAQPCTLDHCVGETCKHWVDYAKALLCDDGSPCTEIDSCFGTSCESLRIGVLDTAFGGTAGYQDGPESQALIREPGGMAVLPDGSVVFAETGAHRIRRWRPGVGVTTVAGTGSPGLLDGPTGSARFNRPMGVTAGPDGAIYVSDSTNNRVRMIQGGVVSTFAGNNTKGSIDGPLGTGSLADPTYLHVGPDGRLYVVDESGLRVITSDGTLSTWWKIPAATSSFPPTVAHKLTGGRFGEFAFMPTGELFFAFKSASSSSESWYVYRRTAANELKVIRPSQSGGFVVLGDGSVVLASNRRLWRGAPGASYVLVGDGTSTDDGLFTEAGISNTTGPFMTLLPDGSVAIPEAGMHSIRVLTFANEGCDDRDTCTADVCTDDGCTHEPLASASACSDGNACTIGDACDAEGACAPGVAESCDDGNVCTDDGCDVWDGGCQHMVNIATCDGGDACNLRMHCVDTSCVAKPPAAVTVAGSETASGFVDGPAATARFASNTTTGTGINGVALASDGALLVSDRENSAIRRVAPDGSVSTLLDGATLRPGALGYGGTGVLGGIATHPSGHVAFTSGNQVVTIRSNQLQIACGALGAGTGTTCTDHVFGTLGALAYAPDGTLYFAEPTAHRIWAIAPDGALTTAAGDGTAGYVDGPVAESRISSPGALTVGRDGTVYFTDASLRVRAIQGGVVVAVAGGGAVKTSPVSTSQLALVKPGALTTLPSGALVVIDNKTTLWTMLDGVANSVSTTGATALAYQPDGSLIFTTKQAVRRFAPNVRECNDGNACTTDSCDATTGDCVHVAVAAGTKCSDLNACTTGDSCDAAGQCLGAAKSCADGETCTDDSCDPIRGDCVHVNRQEPCGDTCDAGRGCWDGVCQADTPLNLHLAGGAIGNVDGDSWHARFRSISEICADADGVIYAVDTTATSTYVLRRVAVDGTTTTLPLPGDGSYLHELACDQYGPVAALTSTNAYERKSDGTWAVRVPVGGTNTKPGAKGVATMRSNLEVSPQSDGSWLYLEYANNNCGTSCAQQLQAFRVAPDGSIALIGTLVLGAASGDPKVSSWSDAPFGTFYVRDTSGGLWALGTGEAFSVGAAAPEMYYPKVTSRNSLVFAKGYRLIEYDIGSATVTAHGDGLALIGTEYGPLSTVSVPYTECTVAGAGRVVVFSGGEFQQLLLPSPRCDDGNPCTTDSCTPDGACSYAIASGSCDDGNACTLSDTCTAGVCSGQPMGCGPTSVCSLGTCTSYFAGTTILSGAEQKQLNAWAGYAATKRWKTCFTSSDGSTGKQLYVACKGKGPSFTVMSSPTSVTAGPAHFGAFQKRAWDLSTDPGFNFFEEDFGAFLFSLDRGGVLPAKNLQSVDHAHVWHPYPYENTTGPKFGNVDLVVSASLGEATSSLGDDYSTAELPCSSCSYWLTGSATFPITRIEVYYPE